MSGDIENFFMRYGRDIQTIIINKNKTIHTISWQAYGGYIDHTDGTCPKAPIWLCGPLLFLCISMSCIHQYIGVASSFQSPRVECHKDY